MRCVLLRGACFQTARPVDHFDGFLVDIKVAASSHAINLSEALKRPERSFGGTTDSKASSFTAGSTRAYLSVVCVFAWPSHSATFRRSFVACRKVKAQVCLRTCGCTRFVVSEGQCCFAVRTCLRRMYSKPERVKDSPRALTNSSGTGTVPLAANQARSAEVVVFHNGRHRSLRPLPWTSTLGCGCNPTRSAWTTLSCGMRGRCVVTLQSYFADYQRSRAHLALGKDPPEPRALEPPERGCVVAIPLIGELHHRYQRHAA